MSKSRGPDVVCLICGSPIRPMLTVHQNPDSAYVALKGTWMWDSDLDAAVFVIDPDTDLVIVPLPNGDTGLITDERNRPTLHIHSACQEDLVEEELNPSTYWDSDGMLSIERE